MGSNKYTPPSLWIMDKKKDRRENAKAHNLNVNEKIKEAITKQPASSDLSDLIIIEELLDAILYLKNGKDPGINMVQGKWLRISSSRITSRLDHLGAWSQVCT